MKKFLAVTLTLLMAFTAMAGFVPRTVSTDTNNQVQLSGTFAGQGKDLYLANDTKRAALENFEMHYSLWNANIHYQLGAANKVNTQGLFDGTNWVILYNVLLTNNLSAPFYAPKYGVGLFMGPILSNLTNYGIVIPSRTGTDGNPVSPEVYRPYTENGTNYWPVVIPNMGRDAAGPSYMAYNRIGFTNFMIYTNFANGDAAPTAILPIQSGNIYGNLGTFDGQMLKINGVYYLFNNGSGSTTGENPTICTSTNIFGPYTMRPLPAFIVGEAGPMSVISINGVFIMVCNNFGSSGNVYYSYDTTNWFPSEYSPMISLNGENAVRGSLMVSNDIYFMGYDNVSFQSPVNPIKYLIKSAFAKGHNGTNIPSSFLDGTLPDSWVSPLTTFEEGNATLFANQGTTWLGTAFTNTDVYQNLDFNSRFNPIMVSSTLMVNASGDYWQITISGAPAGNGVYNPSPSLTTFAGSIAWTNAGVPLSGTSYTIISNSTSSGYFLFDTTNDSLSGSWSNPNGFALQGSYIPTSPMLANSSDITYAWGNLNTGSPLNGFQSTITLVPIILAKMTNGLVFAQGITIPTNTFSLLTATNNMFNGDGRLWGSNGVPVWIYMSNSVPLIYPILSPGNVIIP